MFFEHTDDRTDFVGRVEALVGKRKHGVHDVLKSSAYDSAMTGLDVSQPRISDYHFRHKHVARQAGDASKRNGRRHMAQFGNEEIGRAPHGPSDASGKRSLSERFTEWSLNWVPDSMVFVVALTVVVFLLALALTPHGPMELLDDYAKGFWVLLTFAMQLTVMMITGFVVADSKPVKSTLIRIVGIPRTARSTLIMFCLIVGIVAWLHWAAGLMVAIIMGKEIAVRKRGIGLHYPVLVASAYAMMMLMANGPSQSAPLLAATAGNFLEKSIGGLIPLTQTALSPFLLVFVLFELLTIPFIFVWLTPRKESAVDITDEIHDEFTQAPPAENTKRSDLRPAERWERSRLPLSIVGVGILFWIANFVATHGIGKIDLNVINFALFGIGMVLHGSARSFVASVKQGVGTTSGVIIQFPLYAGIFGLIVHSGLSEVITHWFLSISTPRTYAWIVVIYTTIMDFFVPSGGSKFAIEAPYIIAAGQKLGIPVAHVINAYSTGGQLANLIQPFWALPFITAFRVRFQDILPYTFVIFIYAIVLASIAFLVLPAGL
ncbi:TIGR00366 family protein [Burkholderia multivorans]|uniref:TIGR00366 family protein n=1 Tax=Burkholderia multivorans TaxID=87883 RepID=UPI0020B2D9B3|nr:TIGR00366 family protein [Burkholderia multivorans]